MRLMLPLVLLACVVLIVTASEVPAEKEVIPIEARNGTVTFAHKLHAELEGVECVTCHHGWEGEGAPAACGECHTSSSTEAPKAMKAHHDLCKGCHEAMEEAGRKTGPVKPCKACHVKEE
jgi:predicted CXXCH cytochrome family protein